MNKHQDTPYYQQGLTLIELMLVMVLAAMLTSWGVSQWQHYQQALRLEQTAQQLLAFLTRLQADANWHNRNALIWLRPGQPWCVGSGVPEVPCTTQAGWVFTPEYPEVELQGFTQKEMGFYGVRNNAQAGHILLGNRVGRIRLVLSAKGRLRLCSEETIIRSIALCQS
ncbi:prepilin peptidase dependent protein A [Serratia fonticola]|uniref:Prepilin peptidase dependent protein A n=1 Tax=Serratia fonticola TaxID=47917 RepID=A0A559T7D7_SERFO|nr:prepilin peptidase-dependent protein [Serratia fonticola]TQI81950.1 prepilin peptidase dependent protein A [Serratia fonticola]TQI96027.1 prepilin peptidase dependent protein A [Serratia fonticola]TVZ70524.1 prepilin peptidase dependent protein A [Serratia fonticola]